MHLCLYLIKLLFTKPHWKWSELKGGCQEAILWGYISASGPGDFVRFHGIMNTAKHCQSLSYFAAPSRKCLIGSINNHPKHTNTIGHGLASQKPEVFLNRDEIKNMQPSSKEKL